MIRGIQIIGLLLASVAVAFVFYARKKERISYRFFVFWIIFWGLFLVFDLYPSMVAYVAPALALGPNMYILTAGSVLTLFVLVFMLYSYLSDLNRKVVELTRQYAIIGNRVRKMLEVMNDDRKKDSDNSSGS